LRFYDFKTQVHNMKPFVVMELIETRNSLFHTLVE